MGESKINFMRNTHYLFLPAAKPRSLSGNSSSSSSSSSFSSSSSSPSCYLLFVIKVPKTCPNQLQTPLESVWKISGSRIKLRTGLELIERDIYGSEIEDKKS